MQEISIGLSPLGEKLFELGYVLTNNSIIERHTFHYDIATETFLSEHENKTVLPCKKSFFNNKCYHFLRDYLQEDNNFPFKKNSTFALPIPLSLTEEEDAIKAKIKDGFYFSKQKITKKCLTSRLIEKGLSYTNRQGKISYSIDKEFDETFKNYGEAYIQTILDKQKNSHADAFNFDAHVFKYLSWTAEELKDLLAEHDYIVFIPDETKAHVPCDAPNKIVRISKNLFAPKSEFEFFVYALDYMYSLSQSFYNSNEFKEYHGNRICKEKFFSPLNFYLDNAKDDALFLELLPVVIKTNSLSLFINTVKQQKKIPLQKMLIANRFFKNNSEWAGFFQKYIQDIIFKDIMATGYNNMKNLLALQRIANISEEDILEIIQKAEFRIAIAQTPAFSLLEHQCLWYDELCQHNFTCETIHKNIIALAPQLKERKEISETIYAALSDEFKQRINKAE